MLFRHGTVCRYVVSAKTIDTFKNHLDKFWSDQQVLYDYKADPHGIENCNTPFTRYSRLYNRFDNRQYRVNKHPTGCQTGLTTGWMFVYTIQPVVRSVWQPVWQPCWTNRLFVQPVVKLGCTTSLTNTVSQPCWMNSWLSNRVTRYSRLSNRFDNGFDNRLYRVYKHLTTGLTTGCIV